MAGHSSSICPIAFAGLRETGHVFSSIAGICASAAVKSPVQAGGDATSIFDPKINAITGHVTLKLQSQGLLIRIKPKVHADFAVNIVLVLPRLQFAGKPVHGL